MSDRVLPSREDTLVAISRWVGREPEVAYDLHPDLRVILNAARGWSSGRLVDRENINREAAYQWASENFVPQKFVDQCLDAALGEV